MTVIRLMNEDCANVVNDVGDNVRSQTTQPRNPGCTVHTRSENKKGNEVYKAAQPVLVFRGRGWKVPRGGCKQLKTKDITVRWYENRSVLLEMAKATAMENGLNKNEFYLPQVFKSLQLLKNNFIFMLEILVTL